MKVNFIAWGILMVFILVFTMAAFSACSDESSATLNTTSRPKTTLTSSPPSPSPSRPSGPSVLITSPENLAGLNIGSITVVIKINEFKLTNSSGQSNISGEGHVHYYMDVEAPTTADQPAVTSAGTCAESTAISYVWKNVGSGDHKFSVQLVNNDHTPLNPPAVAAVSLRVTAAAGMPAVVIVSPRDGEVIPGNSVTITAQAANFNLVDKIGQTNAPNEGHLMFYQDVEAPTIQGPQATTRPDSYLATASNSYTWTGLAQGTHTFSIQLVNNNNTPINPPVSAKITLTVK
jgi:hypothetical protein